MANQKILDRKQGIIDEVSEKVKGSASFVAFEYQGLTVAETNELRRSLRASGSDFKIYKNTLVARALKDLNIDLEKETNFGTYYLKGNTYYITNSESETIIGYDMWPYAEVECPIAYNITMGFDHNVIIDGTRQTITFWYVGNVFMPYER